MVLLGLHMYDDFAAFWPPPRSPWQAAAPRTTTRLQRRRSNGQSLNTRLGYGGPGRIRNSGGPRGPPVFGLAITPVAGQIQQQHLPWFTIGFGLLLAAVGGWLLAGRDLPVLLPKLRRAPTVTRSLPSMALFGAAYAIVSFGCTLAPFLAIVVSAFRSGSTLEGITLFTAYAAGMGLTAGEGRVTQRATARRPTGRSEDTVRVAESGVAGPEDVANAARRTADRRR
ncbi:hypothetical protein ABTX62_02425 [Streptomyces sp. NPDC096046]|uniref:cytochrome c biogenesis CcdA family protein n=1 Tax=Streptomyces sp. NPDC096046 TaxID=3155542 RepID=UPI003328982D